MTSASPTKSIRHRQQASSVGDVVLDMGNLLNKPKRRCQTCDAQSRYLPRCTAAALDGHLECLVDAYERGCNWYADTCGSAAEGGHLDCLVYAHENGCKWDSRTCTAAARNGHLACLQYAHQNGCELPRYFSSSHPDHVHCIKLTYMTVQTAESRRCFDCLAYGHEHGCDWTLWSCSEYHHGYIGQCWRYAYDNGVPTISQYDTFYRWDVDVFLVRKLVESIFENVRRSHAALTIQTEFRRRISCNPHNDFGRRFILRSFS